MGSAQEDLRSLAALSDIHDICLDSVVDSVSFTGCSFAGYEDALCVSDVDKDRLIADSLYNAGYQFTLSLDIVVVYHSALSFSESLNYYLLGGLRCDSAEVLRCYLIFHDITRLISRVDFASFLQGDLGCFILYFFYDILLHEHFNITVFLVHFNADIGCCAVVLLVRGNQG